MTGLLKDEVFIVKSLELEHVKLIKKLLLMSVNGSLHIHALRLSRRELGLPQDFRDSILNKYSDEFRLVDLEIVALVDRGGDGGLGVAKVEEWREKEYSEKWLSEFETKFAFPINFPTGFRIEAGFRDKLKTWQRMPYVKPYEGNVVGRGRTPGGVDRFEKRAVGILHELLSLTVEKMIQVERLVHFRKDFGIEVNLRELLLKHPGIFYISTKGSSQLVYLREAYSGGCLVEPNLIHDVRRKMLDLIVVGRRNTRELRTQKEEIKQEVKNVAVCNESERVTGDGDFAISILESCDGRTHSKDVSDSGDISE